MCRVGGREPDEWGHVEPLQSCRGRWTCRGGRLPAGRFAARQAPTALWERNTKQKTMPRRFPPLPKIEKTRRRPYATRRATSAAAAADEESCCICLEEKNDADAAFFPCAHSVCSGCFAKVDVCPICRMGKDGRSAQEREREHAASGRVSVEVARRLRERARNAQEAMLSIWIADVISGSVGPTPNLPQELRDELLQSAVERALSGLAERGARSP